MHGFVTPSRPTRSSGKKLRVIPAADEKLPGGILLLKMAFEAKILVPLQKHLCVHGAVRIVANGAALADRLVFEHERAMLRDVTLPASFVLMGEGGAATFHGLAFVRVVAVAAPDFA